MKPREVVYNSREQQYVSFTCEYSSDQYLRIEIEEYASGGPVASVDALPGALDSKYHKSGSDTRTILITPELSSVRCRVYDQDEDEVASAISKIIRYDGRLISN